MKSTFDVPVVFTVYKRIDTTKKVFEGIREIKPQKLYIVSDGPKNKEEEEKVNEVREYIESQVDWDCQLNKIYAEKNMGIRYRIPTGLNEVFALEEKAIILEDDVCPTKAFFHFCREMLNYYENEEKIFMISGYNPYQDFEAADKIQQDVYITRYPIGWGWATWRRAWNKYTPNIPSWENYRKSKELKKNYLPNAYRFFKILFDDLQYQWYSSWLYQWNYAIIEADGYSVVSKNNLTKNVGVNHVESTHPGDKEEFEKEVNSLPVDNTFEIKKLPKEIKITKEYDDFVSKKLEKTKYKTSVLKLLKYSFRAKIHRICFKYIRQIEMDKEYYDNVFPKKFKLNNEEKKWNNGDMIRLIDPKQLRFCALAYVIYKYTKIDVYK